MRAPSYSTREIIVDFTGDTVPRKGGPAVLGHNPSWVKAADYEALVAQLTDLRGDRDQLQQWKESAMEALGKSVVLHEALKDRGEYLGWNVYDAVVDALTKAENELLALRGAGAALQQQVKEAYAEREAVWQGIEHGYNIEPRAVIERECRTNGFKYPLAQAIHTIWKREPKVAELDADLARLRSRGLALVQQWREKGDLASGNPDYYRAAMLACADALTEMLK